MSTTSDAHRLTVEDHGRVLAEAILRWDPADAVVHADLHVEPGHLPVGTRGRLVDAVVDQFAGSRGARLQVAMPAGDAEILQRIRERCREVEARPAGATCLVNAAL